ncbi:hypothetical protein EON80_04300 [bacterium]|nr:MAG: hypothetical protein EON80_04300 [bacterium]
MLYGTPVSLIPFRFTPLPFTMVDRRELITLCRQIGAMMEVGVDFLRITRALRDQTDNPRLLELYDQLDHELKMGKSLGDAISTAPDVFSPFAVSLVRQGEARGDIEGAWHRLADFLKQEAQEDKDLGVESPAIGTGYIPTGGLPSNGLSVVAPRAPVTVGMFSDLIDRLQSAALRGLTWISAFLFTLAIVWWSVELGFIQSRWMVGIQLCVASVFLAGAGSWLRRSRESDRKRQPVCSFCGKTENDGATLQRSPRLAGAAICAECATTIAKANENSEAEAAQEAQQQQAIAELAAQIEPKDGRRSFPEGFTPSPSHEVTEDENEEVRFTI